MVLCRALCGIKNCAAHGTLFKPWLPEATLVTDMVYQMVDHGIHHVIDLLIL